MPPAMPGGQGPPVDDIPLVALKGVTKAFGSVVANRNVSFALRRGEVLALVGENGAGKSTIVNLLSGLYRGDAGSIEFDGRPLIFASPAEAVAAGIGVVHQHYTLVPAMTVLDNVALATPELGHGRLNRTRLAARVKEIAGGLGFDLDLSARVDALDVASQQRVEIVKALIRDVDVLLLDEPTAVLGPDDKERLFAMIRGLKARGVAVLLITHKLEDIAAVADRLVILRSGEVVADDRPTALTHERIIELMIGSHDPELVSEVEQGTDVTDRPGPSGDTVCRFTNVGLCRPNGSVAVKGLNAVLAAGEILAVAGVDGNGQAELVRCLAGVEAPAEGTIDVLGLHASAHHRLTAAQARRAGVAHIPEDRRRTGIVEQLDLADNFLLGNTENRRFWRRGLVRYRPLIDEVKRRIDVFGIRTTGPQQRLGALSGGNQQKFVVARELSQGPRLLIAAHPSRGLDVRTIHFVHEQLKRQREEGAAILLVSGDLNEILGLADRILVFATGNAFGPFVRGEISLARIGALMAGHGLQASPAA